jgi:hypothetical protein
MVRNMIEDAGGTVVAPAGPARSADDAIAELLTAKEDGVAWAELQGKLTEVIEGIAKGDVKASAAQVSMVKYVLDQAKQAEKGERDGVRNVILLPVQGSGEQLQLDPERRAQLKAAETTDE